MQDSVCILEKLSTRFDLSVLSIKNLIITISTTVNKENKVRENSFSLLHFEQRMATAES